MNTASDVIVLGGGAVGLSCAYYCRKAGHEVTLIERGEPGQACSLHNAGLIAPSHFVPLAHPGVISQGLKWMLDPESPFYIKPRADLDLLRWVWLFRRSSTERHVHASMELLRDLCTQSLRLVEELAGSGGTAFGLQKKGLLLLFNSDKGRRGCLEEAELAARIGVEAVACDEAELQTLDPHARYAALGGVFYPGDAHLSPAAFMRDLTAEVGRMGVKVVTRCDVRRVAVSAGRVERVETTKGAFRGSDYVLAGGSWSATLVRDEGLRIPLEPGKGYSITVSAPAGSPTIPLILTEARVAVTPLGESLRFAGTMELAGLDLTLHRRRIDAIARAAARYIRSIPPPDVQRAELWGGLRPCTPDGLPYVGRFARCRNLIAATGHAMLGITLASVTGRLVREIVDGAAPSVPLEKLAPDRFGP